jgi:outer membrane protein OmpA-like peptidoglycan-associated protein
MRTLLAGSVAVLTLAAAGPLVKAQTSLTATTLSSAGTSATEAPATRLRPVAVERSTALIESLARSTVAIEPFTGPDLAGAAAGPTSLERAAAHAASRIEIAALARSTASIEALKPTDALTVATLKSELNARETERGTLISLPGDILFDFDEHAIRREARPTLAKLAELIRRTPGGRVVIEGHTDAKGSDAYNLQLSERRARAVARWLEQRHGIEPARLDEEGLGETRPTVPNTHPDGSDDPQGRQLNRRVEVILTRWSVHGSTMHAPASLDRTAAGLLEATRFHAQRESALAP